MHGERTGPRIDHLLAPGRRPARRVEHRCRLELRIDGQAYSLRIVPPEAESEARVQYRLRKLDGSGAEYVVSALKDGSIDCDCADAIWRRSGHVSDMCKHAGALKATGLIAVG